jgi:hypothetical protein
VTTNDGRIETVGALLWALIAILVIIWVFGFLVVHLAGPLIHILLIVALILLIWNLLSPRTTA